MFARRISFRFISVVKDRSEVNVTNRYRRSLFGAGRTWLGDNRARTGNLRRAKAVLSQLSYAPKEVQELQAVTDLSLSRPMATQRLAPLGLARVELATSRLSGVRSNQLSYRPERHKEAETFRTPPLV